MVLSASLAEKITKHFVISFLTVPLSSQILIHSGVSSGASFQNLNAADGTQISQFITNLGRFHKKLLLLGCLRLPFDNREFTM